MTLPPTDARSDRRAVLLTALTLVVWLALTVAAPLLAGPVSGVVVQLDPTWRVAPPAAEDLP